MKRGLIPVVAFLAVLLTACGGSSESPSTARDASGVVGALKAAGIPIGDFVAYDAKTDPNELLGRPNAYTSKVNFLDASLARENTTAFDTQDGGAVEVFANAADAKRRAEYIEGIFEALPTLTEYLYVEGPVLVRVSKRLTLDEAAAYEDALKAID